MKKIDLLKLGKRIREFRENEEMSQSDISIKSGLDKARISDIESGKGNPTLQTIGKISNALGVSIDDLLEYEVCGERKLLIIAINILLKENKISLSVDDEKSGDFYGNGGFDGYVITDIEGFKSAVIWNYISWGEIEIKVWWNYDEIEFKKLHQDGNPTPGCGYYELNRFTGCEVQGWLERKDGKFLQGEGKRGILRRYLSRKMKAELDNLKYEKPAGYKAKETFYK
jgi:transcriptional regulator with XRE-family HTH domain